MRASTFATLAILCGLVAAYPKQNSQDLVARDCSAEVSAFNIARRERRGLAERTWYPSLNNLTCVLSPEAPRENYVAGSPVQQNIAGGQTGVSMLLDIGVLDITTCKPLPDAMVEVWSANAQGEYGSSFLRGSFPTASNGIAEFNTIFPGWTSSGANHINVLVHSSSSVSSSASHVGQVFFTDRWSDVIGMSSPYDANTNTRMLNAADPAFKAANSQGYSAIVDIEEIYDDWPEGVSGYITVGINPDRSL